MPRGVEQCLHGWTPVRLLLLCSGFAFGLWACGPGGGGPSDAGSGSDAGSSDAAPADAGLADGGTSTTTAFLNVLTSPADYASLRAPTIEGIKYLSPIPGRNAPSALSAPVYFQNMRRYSWHLQFLQSFPALAQLSFQAYVSMVLSAQRVMHGGEIRDYPAVVHPVTGALGVMAFTLYTDPGTLSDADVIAAHGRLRMAIPYAADRLAFRPEDAAQQGYARAARSRLLAAGLAVVLPEDLEADPSLRGTRFEGVALRWSGPLELCTHWNAFEIARSRGQRAHLSLAPAPRSAPGRGSLSAAPLLGGLLRRGTRAADQHELSSLVQSSTLSEWSLSDPAGSGGSQLLATVRYALGSSGTLVEQISAFRADGDLRPIVVDALAEVSFSLELPGGETIFFERCGVGSEELEDQIHAVVGTRNGATLTLLRELRTREALVGSAPITLTGARLYSSEEPWLEMSAKGFFSWVFASGVHNWNEYADLDFTEDPWSYQGYFAPGAPGLGLSVISRLELSELNPPGGASTGMRVFRRGSDGQTTTEEWQSEGAWRRVDAGALRGRCDQQVVESLTLGPNLVVHLSLCPGPGPLGATLESVLPAVFTPDAADTGHILGPERQTEVMLGGRPAVHVALGSALAAVEIARTGAHEFLVRALDRAGAEVQAATVRALPFVAEPRRQEALSGSGAGGTVTATVVRSTFGQGVGNSTLYVPFLVEARWPGGSARVEAFDRLQYYNTHHNFTDHLTARIEDLEIEWRINSAREQFLTVRRSGSGEVLLPETELR